MSRAPDVQHVAVQCADDSVIVVTLVLTEYQPDGTPRWQRLATDAVVELELVRHSLYWDKRCLPVKGWRFIQPDEIPNDRTFREAWRIPAPRAAITVDMPAAREIHRDRMRVVRAPLLAQLDVEYQRADETGEDKSPVVARKQELRDVTDDPALEIAATPDELKAVWPACLGTRPA